MLSRVFVYLLHSNQSSLWVKNLTWELWFVATDFRNYFPPTFLAFPSMAPILDCAFRQFKRVSGERRDCWSAPGHLCTLTVSLHGDSMCFMFQPFPSIHLGNHLQISLGLLIFFHLKILAFTTCHSQCGVDMSMNVGKFYRELKCPWFEAKYFQTLIKSVLSLEPDFKSLKWVFVFC